jgi:hypothetical protein
MPKPAHVEAFEFISEGTQNEIRDYIAFGLFMRSEDQWASGKARPPTDSEYRKYHESLLTPYERDRYRDGANKVLEGFAASAKRADLLKHHKKFRWFGILEGFGAAFFWTVFLIVSTILAFWGGIDILDKYERIAGIGIYAPRH